MKELQCETRNMFNLTDDSRFGNCQVQVRYGNLLVLITKDRKDG